MAISFHGPWLIEIAGKDAAFSHRYAISGSAGGDGAHPADAATPPLLVDGEAWTLTLEWNDNAGSGWLPSDVRKSASNTLADGLVVLLGADDNLPAARDGDYDDLVLRLRNRDPALNPWLPFPGHPDFTVRNKPRDPRGDARPGGGRPPGDNDPGRDPR